jgi:MFS family permease
MKRITSLGGYGPTFYLAFLACFLFFFSEYVLITPLPLYIESIGGGPPDVGLAGMIFAAAAIAVRPFVGRLTDTKGRKITLFIGTVLFVFGPLAYTVCNSVQLLFAARVFHGAGLAFFTSAYFALIADVTPRERWGEAVGIAGIAPALSIMIGSPIGTSLVAYMSFEGLFLLAAAAAIASLVVALIIREPTRETTSRGSVQRGDVSALEVVRMRGVLAPSLAILTLGLSYGAINSFLPLFARDRALGNVGFFFATHSLVVVISRFGMGRLSDRLGRLPVILPMLFVMAAGYIGLNWTYAFGLLVAMAVVQGVGFGGSRVGLETMVVDNAPAKLRGTALSLLYLCFDSGIALGNLLMGGLASFAGYGRTYALIGVLCILTALVFATVMRKNTPEEASP